MRVAVVGCGAVGARAARQLVTSAEVESIVLRDTRAAWLHALAESLGPKAEVQQPPYEDVADVDGIVLATPSAMQPQLAHAAIERGIPVVATADAIDDVRLLLSLDGDARRRGVSVVVGAGFAPGLTCVLASFGALSFDLVDEVHVAKAGTGGPSCARSHHRALSRTAFDWRDGAWVRRRGGSGRELIWFPEPVGGRDCYRGALADPLLLVSAFPTATRITSRMAATRRDRLTMRLPMLLPPHAEGGPGAARVELRGVRASERDVAVYGVMDRPAVAAGAVAALALLRVLSGEVSGPGAAGLARTVEPKPFLADLSERGVRVAVFDGTPRVPPFPEPS